MFLKLNNNKLFNINLIFQFKLYNLSLMPKQYTILMVCQFKINNNNQIILRHQFMFSKYSRYNMFNNHKIIQLQVNNIIQKIHKIILSFINKISKKSS